MKSTTEILKACRDGNVNFLKKLLQSEESESVVGVKDVNNKTVLHYCMENKQIDCAELILKEWPESIDSQDNSGITPLHLATVLNNTKMIDFLLSEGADVQIADQEKHTAVHWAVVYAQIDALKFLLEKGARVNQPDTHDAYPLHYAAQGCGTKDLESASVEIISELIRAGANPNCTDSLKRTPLHWVVTVGSKKGCSRLIEMGSLVDCADAAGMTVIHCAASKGFTELIIELVSFHGSDVDPLDKNGCSPLFYATSNGHRASVKELVRLGAKLDHQDSKGRTPAHCAAAKNKKEVFEVLIKEGANPWLQNTSGDTPLHEACFVGNQDMIKSLIKHPAAKEKIDTPNSAGQTALHIAAAKQNDAALENLIKNGADVNKTVTLSDGSQLTALNLVKGTPDCERTLSSAGAKSISDINDESSRRNSTKLNKIEEHNDTVDHTAVSDKEDDNQIKESKPKKDKTKSKNVDKPASVKKENNQEGQSIDIVEVSPVFAAGESTQNEDSKSEESLPPKSKSNSVENIRSLKSKSSKDSNKENVSSPPASDQTDAEKKKERATSPDKENDSKEKETSKPKHKPKSHRKDSEKSIESPSSSEKEDDCKEKQISKSTSKSTKPRENEESEPIKRTNKQATKPNRKSSNSRASPVKSYPRGKESNGHNPKFEVRKQNKKRPDNKESKTRSKSSEALSPRISQMKLVMDKNQQVSKEISRQVHISVSNFEYTRFTARAISEYGRQMMRANLPTASKGFPVFPAINLKKRSSRRKRRRPVQKSLSYSRSSSRESIRSYSSKSSSSSSDDDHKNRRKTEKRNSSPSSKTGEDDPPARPQTSMAPNRPHSRRNDSAAKRPMTSSNKRVRSAYAPFLPIK